jgi:hypothetical protein
VSGRRRGGSDQPAMSQIQSFSRSNCVLLAVLCGKHAEKRVAAARSGPEVKRLRPSYPFPELSSAGRLEVSWGVFSLECGDGKFSAPPLFV